MEILVFFVLGVVLGAVGMYFYAKDGQKVADAAVNAAVNTVDNVAKTVEADVKKL